MAKDNIHVVLVPYPAFGHIIPFFQLSIALAKAGVHSHLVTTTRNIKRLPILPPDVTGMVDLVGLQRPPIDPTLLPEDAEATIDVPYEKMHYLRLAYDLLKVPFQEFISSLASPPSWIITDPLSPSWLLDVAQMYNLPVITFYLFSAASSVFFGPPEELRGKGIRHTPESLTTKPPWVDFPSAVAFRKFQAAFMYHELYEKNASGVSVRERFAVLIGSKALAIRSCPELESDYFNLLGKVMTGKQVIPLGFLPPPVTVANIIIDENWKETFKWLDQHKEKSVVFIGFGSDLGLTKHQVHTIAGGLELSGLPFLWALRKPIWADDKEEEEDEGDVLPPGFTTRTGDRGVVRIGWAPQKEILSHPSIGGSLSHGGWGSIIETLQHGHCLVLLPFINDQGLNANLLVEKGLAIEAGIRDEDDSFSQQDIAKALIHGMVSVEGEGLRANAKEAASIFGNKKLNDGYIECFVKYLKNENNCTT